MGKREKIAASVPIYKWERLRSNGENITEASTKKPPFGIATTRSHHKVASCNRAYFQIKFTTEPKVK